MHEQYDKIKLEITMAAFYFTNIIDKRMLKTSNANFTGLNSNIELNKVVTLGYRCLIFLNEFSFVGTVFPPLNEIKDYASEQLNLFGNRVCRNPL